MQLQPVKIGGIKRVKYEGKVYNLSVEDHESYVCNNIVVHNCRSRIVSVLVDQEPKPKVNPAPKSVTDKISPNPFKTKQPTTPTNVKESPAKEEINKRKES